MPGNPAGVAVGLSIVFAQKLIRMAHQAAGTTGGPMLRIAVSFTALIATNLIALNGAAAELLSSRPITIIIPFTPGASSDTLQRIVDKKVSENTGQTLVVESRPGG